MINFKQYTNLTDVVIPDAVQITNADFTNAFNNMQTLQYVRLPNRITNMYQIFNNCQNIIGQSPVCNNQVTNMSNAYQYCRNLIGSPVCGENVVNMSNAYRYCNNITGSPVCGEKVVDMRDAYSGCYNITGSPVCGNNVTNMYGTYFACRNLTGSPVCGDKVTDMSNTYNYCLNITGNPVCGNNVTNMAYTYCNCKNVKGDMYCYNPNITNFAGCFYNRRGAARINIYVPANSITNNTIYQGINNARTSIVGAATSWNVRYLSQNYYYHTTYNLYVYFTL